MNKEQYYHMTNENYFFKNKTLRKYVDVGASMIVNQYHFLILTFLQGVNLIATKNNVHIISSRTGDGYEDARIPIIYISPSGTGKGMVSNFQASIFGKKGLGLRISSISSPTKEKLVGSFDEEQYKRNTRNQVDENSDEELKRKKKYANPVIPGHLEENDMCVFDECEPYFKENEGTFLRIFRRALDTYGSENNELKSETLKNRAGHGYHCKCNIMLLTYPVEGIASKIINNGIFQRCITYFNHVTDEDRQEILSVRKINREYIKKTKLEIVEELKEIEIYIQSLDQFVELPHEVEIFILKRLKALMKKEHKDDKEKAKYLDSFIVRQYNIILKLACAFALMDKRHNISQKDAEQAIFFAEQSYNTVRLSIVEKDIMGQKKKKYALDIKVLGRKIYTKMAVNEIMSKHWGIAISTTIDRLKYVSHLFDDVDPPAYLKGKHHHSTQFVRLRN